MAKQVDHSGFTPLIQACFEYKSWKVSNNIMLCEVIFFIVVLSWSSFLLVCS